MSPASIALSAAAFTFVTAAATVSVVEFIPHEGKPRGGFSAHAACALVAGVIGASVAARVTSLETIVIMCLAIAVLAAAAYAGFFCDGIPADIPLGALAIVAIASLVHGLYAPLLAAVVTGAPFLITALISPDKRSTLRDGAVAAIGGAILGLQFGIGATILGSVVAVISFKAAKANGMAQSYAPYLACAFGLAVITFAMFAT